MHAPAVIRLHRHGVDTSGHPKTGLWMQRVLDDPDVQAWLREAESLPAIWYDEYLLPGDPKGALLRARPRDQA